MTEIRHRSILANGIRMHLAEAGEGFPIVMCHGWPELWFSWRHQLRALSAAGFRAIAPDMRGYGETDAPADPAQYRTSVICADIRGILDGLGLERAVIVGHDWAGTTFGSSASASPRGAPG
jgi:soluble epoxide hydrolase / lipid-phosphate phosphatase